MNSNQPKVTSIFINPDALEEVAMADNLDASQLVESTRIEEKIDFWLNNSNPKNRIVAYVGKFGSGKSVILNYLKRKDEANSISTVRSFLDKFNQLIGGRNNKSQKYYWFQFDIWRYSNREQIWEGFVIELLALIKGVDDVKEIADEIEGHKVKGALVKFSNFVENHPIITMLVVLVTWFSVSFVLWYSFLEIDNAVEGFSKSLIKNGLSMLFVLLAFLGLSSITPKTNKPIKRVFEFEERLAAILQKTGKPVVAIIEDVDRAGDDGLVFMETLRNFIKNQKYNFQGNFVAIAPQDYTYFSIDGDQKLGGFNRSLKIYDGVIFSSNSQLTFSLVSEILTTAGVNTKYKPGLEQVCNLIVQFFRDENFISSRLLKYCLRMTDEFLTAYPSANPSLTLLLLLSRHIEVSSPYSSGKQLASESILTRGHYYIKSAMPNPFVQEIVKISGYDINKIEQLELKFEQTSKEIEPTQTISNSISRGIILKVALDSKYEQLLR